MLSQRAQRAGLKELEIFDNFEIDQNLPKHKKEGTDKNDNTQIPALSLSGSDAWISVPTAWNNTTNAISGVSTWGMNGITVINQPPKPTIKECMINWLLKKLQKTQSTQIEQEKKTKKIMTVVEFFTSLTGSYEELTPIAEIAEHFKDAVIQANVMGQTALLEKLRDTMDIFRGEAHLISLGLNRYVTEKQVCDFYEKVGEDKNLKLTWIKNFNRIIPEKVYLVKKEADDRKIFDNYVILHYDPQDNGQEMTKAEKEKKKDPILFGVFKNSRKLYFVADWKDEFCDLTLEEMFKTLGEKVLKINNKSVKTYIDKTKV